MEVSTQFQKTWEARQNTSDRQVHKAVRVKLKVQCRVQELGHDRNKQCLWGQTTENEQSHLKREVIRAATDIVEDRVS